MEGAISMGAMVAALFIVAARRVVPAVRLVMLQSLAVAALLLASGAGGWEPVAAAAVAALVKGVAMPLVLMRVVKKTGSQVGEDTVGLNARLLISAVLVALAFRFAQVLNFSGHNLAVTAAALATLMLGLLAMLAKRLALMQALGLVVMENGLFMVALSLTGPMPALVELGVLLDALVGIMVMGVLITNIKDTFDSLDTQELTNLKG